MEVLQVTHTFGPQAAPYRQHKALLANGINSKAVGHNAFVEGIEPWPFPFRPAYWVTRKLFSLLNRAPLLVYPERSRQLQWSSSWAGFNLAAVEKKFRPNIINLHWLAAGTINLGSMQQVTVPIVWTLHDVWPLTAGCHCNFSCDNWQKTECVACPQLGACLLPADLGHMLWKKKHTSCQLSEKLTVVCPSRWLQNMAQQSPLFEGRTIMHIPNCVDTTVFQPLEKNKEKAALKLPMDKVVLAFGAASVFSPYKGFDLLLAALEQLPKQLKDKIHIVTFGSLDKELALPYSCTHFDFITDPNVLVSLYSASDIFINPSKQDISSNTCMEAAACGTPCLAFQTGGIPEIVINNETGFIVPNYDTNEFSKKLALLIENDALRNTMGKASREFILATHSMPVIARQYASLYHALAGENDSVLI